MRTVQIGVAVLLGLSALSLAALPQDPAAKREPIKYGDRLTPWIGCNFELSPDRTVASHTGGPGIGKLVAIGVDYAEFEGQHGNRFLVPLAVLSFDVGTPDK